MAHNMNPVGVAVYIYKLSQDGSTMADLKVLEMIRPVPLARINPQSYFLIPPDSILSSENTYQSDAVFNTIVFDELKWFATEQKQLNQHSPFLVALYTWLSKYHLINRL